MPLINWYSLKSVAVKYTHLAYIKILAAAWLTLSLAATFAQPAAPVLQKSDTHTYFSIQKAFYDHWAPYNVSDDGYYVVNGVRHKAGGWKQFKRWENYWDVRVDPATGRFPLHRAADYHAPRPQTPPGRSPNGSWTCMGPFTTTGGYAGLGRLNCIAFREGDNNTFYVGAPSGGLWKTTDGGATWSPMTDQNAVLGVSDAIVVAGSSPATDTIYIGTGDRDGGSMWSLGGGQYNDNNSIGVLKSVDGGTTWAATGLSFATSQYRTINRMLLHPASDLTLFAATSAGLYKTTDGGANWSLLTSTHFVDIKFKPGDPTILYGSRWNGAIHRSTDGGTSFSIVADYYGAGGRRIDLAVSADDPAVVYAIVVNASSGLLGIYKSTNSGASFAVKYNGPNLLAWNCNGGDAGGQGWYDLAIAADPNDAGKVYIGGVNTWKSTDGGTSWSISNHWTGGCSVTAVHADQHYLAFQNGTSTLFECNDGGLYKSTDNGASWIHLGSGLVISQMYRLGVSQTVANEVVCGLQDNGTKALLNGAWEDVIGGDGMECAIDYTNSNIQYGELYYGYLKRTQNHWGSYTAITTGMSDTAWWVMPFVIDPNVHTTLYAGRQNVFRSTNSGTNWTPISAWGTSATIRSLAVSPSNSSHIYAATPSQIYHTANGGTNWTNITGSLPTGSTSITYISVKDDDPTTVWVSLGQYNSNGVFESTDAGSTWTNVSAGLPPIPVMCVIQNKLNTAEVELYAATDVGVYVRIGSGTWSLFSDGLPNVVVNEIEIYYNMASPGLSRLLAATSGRGLWESELYTPPDTPPIADFMADMTDPGVGQTVSFTDRSVNLPTAWSWSFTPSTVTYINSTGPGSQSPQVTFDATGTYSVQLTATNAYGSDIEIKNAYITTAVLLTYCTASGGGAEHISGVQLGSISNTGTGSDGYSDYRSLSTDLTIHQSYNITVSIANYFSGDDLGVWVDWNQDGDFLDTDENVVCTIDNATPGTYSFTVPNDALLGPTTLRIRLKYNISDCGSPCGATSFGEVEDYQVVVQPGANTWLGYSTQWNDVGNWSDGAVPNGSYNVTIPSSPAGGNFPSVLNGYTGQCNELILENGASINIIGALNIANP